MAGAGGNRALARRAGDQDGLRDAPSARNPWSASASSFWRSLKLGRNHRASGLEPDGDCDSRPSARRKSEKNDSAIPDVHRSDARFDYRLARISARAKTQSTLGI
jgi:hypothetical protein